MLNPEGAPALSDWSMTPAKTHLNHGSYGAVPVAAQQHQHELKAQMDSNACTWFMGQAATLAATRVGIANFLRIPADDMALVINASAGVSAVYNSLPFTQGAEIVTTNHTYGAVLEGAKRAARKHGGLVRIAEVPLDADAALVLALVMAQVNARTGLIVIDQITSATARSFPVVEIAAAAARLGVPVLVDGAHAPGTLANPVPDFEGFWVGNLHKFACAPRGTAALVARGPFRHQRILDLAEVAARPLGIITYGAVSVVAEVVPDTTPLGPTDAPDDLQALAVDPAELATLHTDIVAGTTEAADVALRAEPTASYVVQAGTFGDVRNARAVLDKIQGLEPTLFVTTRTSASAQGKTLNRIVVGRFATAAEANAVRVRLARAGVASLVRQTENL